MLVTPVVVAAWKRIVSDRSLKKPGTAAKAIYSHGNPSKQTLRRQAQRYRARYRGAPEDETTTFQVVRLINERYAKRAGLILRFCFSN